MTITTVAPVACDTALRQAGILSVEPTGRHVTVEIDCADLIQGLLETVARELHGDPFAAGGQLDSLLAELADACEQRDNPEHCRYADQGPVPAVYQDGCERVDGTLTALREWAPFFSLRIALPATVADHLGLRLFAAAGQTGSQQ